MSFPFPAVAPARPPAIDNRTLAQLTRLAHDARHGNCSEAEAEWVLTSAAAIMEECARWRAFGASLNITADAVNVIHLPIAR